MRGLADHIHTNLKLEVRFVKVGRSQRDQEWWSTPVIQDLGSRGRKTTNSKPVFHKPTIQTVDQPSDQTKENISKYINPGSYQMEILIPFSTLAIE